MALLANARTFDDVDDRILCSIGACNVTGAYTFAALVDRAGNESNDPLVWLHNSAGAAIRGVFIGSTLNFINWEQVNGGGAGGGTATNAFAAADGWAVIVMGKAAGTATPRASIYKFAAPGWAHENCGSIGNCATAAGGTLRIGDYSNATNVHNGDIAAAAVWDRNLTDVERATLHTGLQAWMALTPVGCWNLDQVSAATALTDLTGNGANQSSIVGTTAHAVTGVNFDMALATLQDVLPDADIATTGWTTTPLFSKVNDASDATVITSTLV